MSIPDDFVRRGAQWTRLYTCIWCPAPRSAPAGVCQCPGVGTFTQSQPRVLGPSHGKGEDTLGRATAAARCWADTLECSGAPAACDGAESDVVRCDAGRPWSAAVSNERYASGDALLRSSPGGPLHDGDGFVAATFYARGTGTSAIGDV